MLVINKVTDAVKSTPLLNFPKKPWYVLAPKIHVESKGPALKISVPAGFELDVTFCFYCPEWPTNSDWPSRPRYWPSMADAQRIMSLGCHVVATSAPSGTRRTKPGDSLSLWQNVNYQSLYPIQQGNVSWQ